MPPLAAILSVNAPFVSRRGVVSRPKIALLARNDLITKGSGCVLQVSVPARQFGVARLAENNQRRQMHGVIPSQPEALRKIPGSQYKVLVDDDPEE